MKKSIALFCFMMVRIIALPAQDIDSMMGLYAGDFQQEKIYIHFDKSIYNKGETLWFKAYVMTGSEPSGYSKNFYVDWFSDEGKLLSHTASPMFESSARGQFIIPEKYSGQLIHVKAYTNWMLNFDTAFLYYKDLLIYQPVAKKEDIQNGKPVATIQFFPEGGDLVGGVMQRVAFLATNQYALPVSVTGVLKNSRNELIDSFSTRHDGMGLFTLYVEAKETYSATWVDEYGENHSTNLPVTRQAAATMLVRPSNAKITFVISRSEEAADNFKTLYTVAHMNQQLLYKSRINFSSITSVTGEIQIQDFPTGILQITLFDANQVPIAERVVFVNNNKYRFEPAISIIEKGLSKRARNSIDLVVEDSVSSNMSIAVTDAGVLNDGSNSIISQLLLAGDIKGYVHNPSYYFSSDADSVHQHLDMVMLTHGWRRFDWAAISKNRLPNITNAKDTDYLQIKGSIDGLNKAKPAKPNQVINLILQAKDSSKQFLFLPVSTQGTFLQKGIIFYDTIKIYYQFNGDKRLTNNAKVSFKNGLTEPPSKLFNVVAVSPLLYNQGGKDSLVSERSKLFYDEKLRLDKMSAATLLPEVRLISKVKTAKDSLDERYTTGFFSGGDAREFDVANDPFALGAPDVFTYLQGRVAGLQINNNGRETRLNLRGNSPDVFLDEMHTEIDQLRNISMSDVAYVKVFRPPFFGSVGGGPGGAIAVYTRKGGDVKYIPGEGLGFKTLAGYAAYKEFYSPDYTISQPVQPDVRTTLYWNPFILTDKKNKVYHIEFYNNDISNKLRIILEGINADGKLTRIEKVLE